MWNKCILYRSPIQTPTTRVLAFHANPSEMTLMTKLSSWPLLRSSMYLTVSPEDYRRFRRVLFISLTANEAFAGARVRSHPADAKCSHNGTSPMEFQRSLSVCDYIRYDMSTLQNDAPMGASILFLSRYMGITWNYSTSAACDPKTDGQTAMIAGYHPLQQF